MQAQDLAIAFPKGLHGLDLAQALCACGSQNGRYPGAGMDLICVFQVRSTDSVFSMCRVLSLGLLEVHSV